MKRLALALAIAIAAIAWWEYAAEWLDKPMTYRLLFLYLGLGVAATCWNTYAVFRFDKMLRNVRADESLGLADPGSTMFAANQRFRYIARSIESMMIIAVSIMGIIAIHKAHLRQSHNYIRLVVTYLVGSVTLTGFLTVRDLRVINAVRRAASEDAAVLRPILRYKSGNKQEEEMADGSES